MPASASYHAGMANLSDIVSSAFWRVNPPDADPVETREWLEAFDALIASEGRERATFLLRKLLDHAGGRRPHRELRLGGGSLRGGLQPLLPRRSTRGPGVFPAPFRAGRVCAGLPGGSSFRKPIESLSA